MADESIAFGTYAGGTEAGSQYTYRVKKSGAYGGYAIVKEVRAYTMCSYHHGCDLVYTAIGVLYKAVTLMLLCSIIHSH